MIDSTRYVASITLLSRTMKVCSPLVRYTSHAASSSFLPIKVKGNTGAVGGGGALGFTGGGGGGTQLWLPNSVSVLLAMLAPPINSLRGSSTRMVGSGLALPLRGLLSAPAVVAVVPAAGNH